MTKIQKNGMLALATAILLIAFSVHSVFARAEIGSLYTATAISSEKKIGVEQSCATLHGHLTSFQTQINKSVSIDPELRAEALAEIQEYQTNVSTLQQQLHNTASDDSAISMLQKIQPTAAEAQKIMEKWSVRFATRQLENASAKVEEVLQDLSSLNKAETKSLYQEALDKQQTAEDALAAARNAIEDKEYARVANKNAIARTAIKQTVTTLHKMTSQLKHQK